MAEYRKILCFKCGKDMTLVADTEDNDKWIFYGACHACMILTKIRQGDKRIGEILNIKQVN